MKQIQIQENWNREPLREILITLESGGRPKGGAIAEGIPSIGGEHLNYNGKFNFEKMKFVPETYFKSMNRGLIKRGDVLIVKDGATTGKTSFVGSNFPYEKSAVNEHVFIARPNDKLFSKYLFYFLYSIEGQEQLKKAITGSAQGGINLSILDKISVKFPISIPLQTRIVSAIETQFTRLDDAVKSLKAVKQKIELYRKAVLKKSFEKKEGWEEKKIGEIIKTSSGGTPSRGKEEYYLGDIPWLKSGELKDNQKIEDSKEHITKEAIDNSSAKIFPKNSVLIAMYGATTGKLGILNKSCSTNQAVCAFLPNKKFKSKFIFYLLLNKRIQIINEGKGGAQPNISQTVLKNIKFPIPSLPLQQKIVSDIESKFSVIDKVEQIVNQSLLKAEMLRKSILKSAFEGRLIKA